MTQEQGGGATPRRRHVYISCVTYLGTVEPETGVSLKRAIQQLKDAGIEHTFEAWSGDSLIGDARNGVLSNFLASGADDLVFIDSDVAWDGDEFMRLLSYPVDLVAGVYRQKKDEEVYPVEYLHRGGRWDDPATGLLEVNGAPTGFMRITRNCAFRMSVYYADRLYNHRHSNTGKAWDVFPIGLVDSSYFGEDMGFCRMWKATEGQVWVDAEMTLHHVGLTDSRNPNKGKKTYTGCLGDYLRRIAPDEQAA